MHPNKDIIIPIELNKKKILVPNTLNATLQILQAEHKDQVSVKLLIPPIRHPKAPKIEQKEGFSAQNLEYDARAIKTGNSVRPPRFIS